MKYAITTLGCKVNQYETQAMETLLREHGHSPAGPGERADAVIVNTCAVTAESGRKSRQALRHLLQQNPGAVSAVSGCWSQISPEDAQSLGADVIYGTGHHLQLVEDLERLSRERTEGEREIVRNLDDPFRRMTFEPLDAGAFAGHARAYLKIQDGCDNFCTYCIIPFTRGRVRSLPQAEAAAQAARLAQEGYRELVLTGIEIASYGKDLRDGSDLASAVEAIAAAAPGLRLRLGSLEPTVVTEEFCRRTAQTGALCRHFHLALQSGCDRTLAGMHRKYTTEEFFAVTQRLRRWFPGCGLTADLITGFPGETQEDHEATLAFLRRVGFSKVHVFPYSRRPGTKADAMPGQLTRAVKAARAQQAQRVADETESAFLRACVGRELEVLFETQQDGLWHGHSDTYCEVLAEGECERGTIRTARITGVKDLMLLGKII